MNDVPVLGVNATVAIVADSDKVKQHLLPHADVGQVMDLGGAVDPATLTDATGAGENTDAERLPFLGQKILVVPGPPFPGLLGTVRVQLLLGPLRPRLAKGVVPLRQPGEENVALGNAAEVTAAAKTLPDGHEDTIGIAPAADLRFRVVAVPGRGPGIGTQDGTSSAAAAGTRSGSLTNPSSALRYWCNCISARAASP